MIAQELEVSLHMAFVEARQARQEFITVEHLLLALLDNPSAAAADDSEHAVSGGASATQAVGSGTSTRAACNVAACSRSCSTCMSSSPIFASSSFTLSFSRCVSGPAALVPLALPSWCVRPSRSFSSDLTSVSSRDNAAS